MFLGSEFGSPAREIGMECKPNAIEKSKQSDMKTETHVDRLEKHKRPAG